MSRIFPFELSRYAPIPVQLHRSPTPSKKLADMAFTTPTLVVVSKATTGLSFVSSRAANSTVRLRRPARLTPVATASPIDDPGPAIEEIFPKFKTENDDGKPRRILSCDGGGIRGLVEAQALAKLEEDLQNHYEDPDYRLGHFFDLVAGTSTGAIMAGWIAMGKEMKSLIDVYNNECGTIFRKPWYNRMPLLRSLTSTFLTKYSSSGILEVLTNYCGDRPMDSEYTENGEKFFLCDFIAVTKNFNTSNDLFVHTSPTSPTYKSTRKLLMRDAIRASAAAPTFFPPVILNVDGEEGEYVDGAVTLYNNPAFRALTRATYPGYTYGWAVGPQNLFVVSAGTGYARQKIKYGNVSKFGNLAWAVHLLKSMMNDSQLESSRLMKLVTYDPNDFADLRVERRIPDFQNIPERDVITLATYYRYNVMLSVPRLWTLLGQGKWEELYRSLSGHRDPKEAQTEALEKLSQIDDYDPRTRAAFEEIGRALVSEQYCFDQVKPFLRPGDGKKR